MPYGPYLPFWFGWPVWVIFLILSVAIAVRFIYLYWKKMDSQLAELPAAVIELRKPGVLDERLTESACRDLWQQGVALAVRHQPSAGSNPPGETLESILSNSPLVFTQFRATLIKSLSTGELASVLLEVMNEQICIMAFSGRHEHPKLLHRYSAMSGGWLRYAATLRETCSNAGRIHCFLFFIDQEARSGMCAYCLESQEGGIALETLLDEQEKRQAGLNMIQDSRQLFLA